MWSPDIKREEASRAAGDNEFFSQAPGETPGREQTGCRPEVTAAAPVIAVAALFGQAPGSGHELLLEKVRALEEKVRALEGERDFLRRTIDRLTAGAGEARGPTPVVAENVAPEPTTSGAPPPPESPSTSGAAARPGDSAPRSRRRPVSRREKTMKQLGKVSSVRAKTPQDILERYRRALQVFRAEGSMQKAFRRLRVDRNTLALTAPLAEAMIAAPRLLAELGRFRPGADRLLQYARRCAASMPADVRERIRAMKARGELLPITYKLK